METQGQFTHREFIAFFLGLLFVSLAIATSPGPSVAVGIPQDAAYDVCVRQNPRAQQQCLEKWKSDISNECKDSAVCSQSPACQTYCTEKGSSAKGNEGCCVGGPKMAPGKPNPCPDEIDGKCEKPELTKGVAEEKSGGNEPQASGSPGLPGAPKTESKPQQGQEGQSSNIDSCALGFNCSESNATPDDGHVSATREEIIDLPGNPEASSDQLPIEDSDNTPTLPDGTEQPIEVPEGLLGRLRQLQGEGLDIGPSPYEQFGGDSQNTPEWPNNAPSTFGDPSDSNNLTPVDDRNSIGIEEQSYQSPIAEAARAVSSRVQSVLGAIGSALSGVLDRLPRFFGR